MTAEPVDPTVARGYRRLFEPLEIGNFTIRNRIVNTTHGTGLSEDRDLRYLQERARGGAALLGLHGSQGVLNYAVGPTPTSPAPNWDQQLVSPVSDAGVAFYDETVIPYMAKRAAVVHAEGAKCFAQVYHLGAAGHAQRITPPIAPSAVSDPYDALTPHPLTGDEIEEVIFAFAHGIRRVRDAGMDAAEIHGAHGYLVNEFLSPYFNRRNDEWGGSLANRLRFLRRIIAAARELVGDFPIGLRIGVDGDGVHRGITVEGLAEIAHAVSGDVQYISVTGGNYAGFGQGHELAYVSPWYREPGFNAGAATAVKKVVDVPVLVTGRIADAAVAEGILADGSADMVGMVRALIADPELPNKARRGDVAEVRMCLGLSECHYIGPHRTALTCAVNASAAREGEMDLVPTERPKTVVVVGAGPAGMEAARVARQRGHTVFLCDEAREIGGTPRVLSLDPNRRNLRDHAVFFQTQLVRLGVQLMLGNRVSAEDLAEFAPDVVVVATGGEPLVPDVPGIDGTHVATALEVLSGAVAVGARAIVVGGLDNHIAAPTVAEFLADGGAEVECLSEHVDFATGSEDGTRLALLHRLMNKGVRISRCHRLVSALDGGAVVEDTFTGDRRTIVDASVVLACGLVPNDGLAADLRGRVPEVHVIGDALAPRRLMHATLEGARVGRLL
jgi:2,4-dienoyl-CoA reductase-like NADH-dependent reductase (Old Yellow Enzyme family)/thioredoxin reductase